MSVEISLKELGFQYFCFPCFIFVCVCTRASIWVWVWRETEHMWVHANWISCSSLSSLQETKVLLILWAERPPCLQMPAWYLWGLLSHSENDQKVILFFRPFHPEVTWFFSPFQKIFFISFFFLTPQNEGDLLALRVFPLKWCCCLGAINYSVKNDGGLVRIWAIRPSEPSPQPEE